ncbi:MAG: hypothetical protein ACREF6_13920, partial [Alphaproteobacteria bacterium]
SINCGPILGFLSEADGPSRQCSPGMTARYSTHRILRQDEAPPAFSTAGLLFRLLPILAINGE